MPIVIEREGKTVSEAIIRACEDLGVTRNEIEVQVLEEGSKGVLGIGGREARVRITVTKSDISEKGLRAKKALQDILGYIVSSHSITLNETADKIELDVKISDDKGLLIGRKGEMIKALEYITGKISGRFCEDGREKRVLIDVDDYKRRREESISRMVKDTVKKVRKIGKPITLEPMSAFERRITYITLKQESGITYETRGSGEEKRIVINPQRHHRARDRESNQTGA
ncbi:MAG TPA: RNA-binding cell elongation regulator Jag/EloR [Thermodesulfobacteriota bacterium]|jgi:spoIIIJ-associated protein